MKNRFPFFNFISHLLCHCLLMLAVGMPMGLAQDVEQVVVGLPSITEDQAVVFQDCNAARDAANLAGNNGDAAYNKCMTDNQAIAGGRAGVLVTPTTTTTDTGDINAEMTHSQAAALIMAVLISIGGVWYVIQCPTQPSAWLFAATSLYWIVREAIAIGTRENGSEINMESLTQTTEEQKTAQQAALEVAKLETEEAAEWAEGRSDFMMHVFYGYLATVVIAIVEALLVHGVITTTWALPMFDQCKGAPDAVVFNDKKNDFDRYDQMFKSKDLYTKTYSSQEFLKSKFTPAQKPSIIQELDELAAANTRPAFEDAFPSMEDPKFEQKFSVKVKSTLSSVFMENANAGHGWQIFVDIIMALGVTAAALVIFKALKAPSKFSSVVRAIFYAVMAAMVMGAKVINDDKAEKLRARAAAYDELSRAIQVRMAPQGPAVSASVATVGNGDVAIVQNGSVADIPPVTPPNCMQGNPTQPNNATVGPCPCTAPKGCTSMDISNMPDPTAGGNIPPFLSGLANTFANGAKDSASGKDASGRLNSATSGPAFAKLKKTKKDLSKKLDDLLKKKFKNAKPFAEMEKEALKKFGSSLKTLQSQISPSDMAKIGSVLGGGDASGDKMDGNLKKLGIDELAKSKGINIPSSGSLPSSNLFGDDDAAASIDAKTEEVNPADALSGFENSEQDILKDSGVSIFEQISVRYRKSAFPIFFVKRKDLQTDEVKNVPLKIPVPETPVKN